MEMEREARRKKIKSREMDRMALITGRIQNLDTAISKSSSFSDIRTDDLPKHSRSSSEPGPSHLLLDRAHGGYDDEDDDVSNTDNDEDSPKQNPSAFRRRNRSSSALVATSDSDDEKHARKPLEYHLSSITPKDINNSILSSEKTRVICSFVIAVLVVLSHIDTAQRVVKSKSLIAYRPLYALMLSDLLIVSATLVLLSQWKDNEEEVKFEKHVNWDGAVKVLEWGIILHQTVRAIFIDCSLYVAIVICGLALVR